MQVLKMRPGSGWSWVTEGFKLLRRQPLALLALVFLFLILLTLPGAVVPMVGGFLPLLLTPPLSFGLMCAFRIADRGERPRPSHLLAGLRDNGAWKPLLVLGGFNALATLLALTLTTAVDGGALMRIVTGTMESGDPALKEAPLAVAGLLFLLVYTPLQMALWYAPMFVAWHRLSATKALFFSLVAVWRNRAAFLLFVLGWVGVALGVSLALQVLRGVLGDSTLLVLLLSPLSLAMLTALYGSIWATYRDPIRDEAVAPLAP